MTRLILSFVEASVLVIMILTLVVLVILPAALIAILAAILTSFPNFLPRAAQVPRPRPRRERAAGVLSQQASAARPRLIAGGKGR